MEFSQAELLEYLEYLIEKQKPKKPTVTVTEKPTDKGLMRREVYHCPCCETALYIQNHIEFKREDGEGFRRFPQGRKDNHCHACGQFMDWSGCNE